ncbi:MAG TPA: hypothetical protein VKT77_02330 [Chthonomonadaceae bacterium]|nr:hypothetical protein [Chthonomonadaceae bacterium]
MDTPMGTITGTLTRAGLATIALCMGGTALAAPGGEQDGSQLAVRVETQLAQTQDGTAESRVALPNGVTIVQEHGAGLKSKLLALAGQDTVDKQALKNFAVAQVYQNMSTFTSPEMAKKTREIVLLRRILELKLTARDIEEALPLLKELKNVDKVTPVKPEQALEDEYERLLRAKPGDPLPSSSAEALRDAASGYRARKQAIWDRMAEKIGKEKAAGIHGMLRAEFTTYWNGATGWQNLLTAPRAAVPGAPRQRAPRVAPTPPNSGDPNLFLDNTPPSLFPGHPHALIDPTAPTTERDPDPFTAPNAPALPADPTDDLSAARTAAHASGLLSAALDSQDPRAPQVTIVTADGSIRVAAQDAPQNSVPALPQTEPAPAARAQSGSTRRSTRTQSGSSNTVIAAPGQSVFLGQNGARTMIFSSYGQASLDELIDLFERKLAAMRR